jgi:hypothetical protein
MATLLALATDLQALRCIASRTISMLLIKHTTSTRIPVFTQTSSFHKYYLVTLLMCGVFFKLYMKLTLHCNRRFGHIKKENKPVPLLLQRHLPHWYRGPAVSMKGELPVARETLGQFPLPTEYVVPM